MSAPIFSLEGKSIFVAGHAGLVGSAVVRRLEQENCKVLKATRQEMDLCNQSAVKDWIAENKPDAIILAAAKVGGILANDSYPADFLYDNLVIQNNVIEAAFQQNTSKLLFLGSSCIYPKFAPQPISENALLTGALEPTNEWYAIAKIAGLKLCEAYRKQYGRDFISVMPTNLYGPGDNFDLQSSHVIPALLRKAHEAKMRGDSTISVWGTGSPRREFLHVDDAADGLVHLLKTYSEASHVNLGCGEDVSILELTKLVCQVVGFEGEIVTDPTKPDGTPRKLLDVGKLFATGWRPKHTLESGLKNAYQWFLDHKNTARL